jgi:hypothetical protein
VLGVTVSLHSRDRGEATGRVLGPMVLILFAGVIPIIFPNLVAIAAAAATPPFQIWASLLSYDDVHAFRRAVASDQFKLAGVRSAAGVWVLYLVSVSVLAAQVLGAVLLFRRSVRRFDESVGRPVRSRGNTVERRVGSPGKNGVKSSAGLTIESEEPMLAGLGQPAAHEANDLS